MYKITRVGNLALFRLFIVSKVQQYLSFWNWQVERLRDCLLPPAGQTYEVSVQ